MATELFLEATSATVIPSGTSGLDDGTTAPAAGTQETWQVSAPAGFVDVNGLTASSTDYAPRQFRCVDPADGSAQPEIFLITHVAGDVFTVTRGADNTAPVAHAAGFTIKPVVSSAAATALASILAIGSFGTASDGVWHITSNTVLTSDVYASHIIVDAGVSLFTYGQSLYATEYIENNGTISVRGNDGSGSTAGSGTWSNSAAYASCVPGSGGGAGNTGAGTAGGNAYTTPAGQAGAGGAGSSGGGGAAGSSRPVGIFTSSQAKHWPGRLLYALGIYYDGPQGPGGQGILTIGAGVGGGGGGGDGTNKGGGGGSGGGAMRMHTPLVINNGAIDLSGGNGGVPTAGNCGGGGAGSGGVLLGICHAWTGAAPLLNGGTGGAGIGTGAAGHDGTPGYDLMLKA